MSIKTVEAYLSDAPCPACHAPLRPATAKERPPRSGDFGMCYHCGGLLMIAGEDASQWREATQEDINFLRRDHPLVYRDLMDLLDRYIAHIVHKPRKYQLYE